MEIKTIDARGLSCPEPVLLTSEMIDSGAQQPFVVLLSSNNARDNVVSLLEKNNMAYSEETMDSEYKITVRYE